jgi:hypothetical protein
MAAVSLLVGPLLVVLAASGAEAIEIAHARGDHDEVARQAGRTGAAGIAPLLADPARRHAGLAAAPEAPDAWELLDVLAALAGSWERAVAAPAAHAAARIARRLDPELAILHDLADDALAGRQQAWLALAIRPDRWADVRVHALEVVARIAETRRATADEEPGAGYDLEALLGDGDPEVRRAACELLPQPAPADALARLGHAVADDADPGVALVCAQALCAGLLWDPATPVLTALGEPGAERLRAIARGRLPEVPAGALVDAARCLAVRGGADDLAALRALESKAPAAVRGMVRQAGRRR